MCKRATARLYLVMMEKQLIEDILPAFFEGTLTHENKVKVEEWKSESVENEMLFAHSKQIWEQTELLRRMQKYNAQKALNKLNEKINNQSSRRFIHLFQKIAAILVLPLLLSSIYFAIIKSSPNINKNNWNTLKTGAGMRSEFVLPDGTNVFLNSNTTLKYPLTFNGDIREVKLLGQAYFDVAKNTDQPFVLNTGKIQVEVTGTEFEASNYLSEELTEIVLVEGSINLCQTNENTERKVIQSMIPGEKATLDEQKSRLYIDKVDITKYIAWKEGRLVFRDDSLEEVVRRLNRWYNVEIILAGNDFGDYAYTATFEDESLIQVLNLLKISAPIDYNIVERKRKTDNSFSKMKIEIIKI